ncbi:hypothetical protein SAMN05444166_6274 [Singulisphaera sp. GP187]|nr:hypothetical protein SAMN05444166_6274 [Singulisphaera sp. GP187]
MGIKRSPGCKCCGCFLGPCTATIPEVLSFYDTYYGVTMAAIWTPANPLIPCGPGNWIAYNLLSYPGASRVSTCPASTVAMRYMMYFPYTAGVPATTPAFSLSWTSVAGCPSGGTIPAGPWNAVSTPNNGFVYHASSCTPTYSAEFYWNVGSPIYDSYIFPAVRLLVTTPP